MAMVVTGSPAPTIPVMSSLRLRSYLKMPSGCRRLGDQAGINLRHRQRRECTDSLRLGGTLRACRKLVGLVGKLLYIKPIATRLKRS